MHRSHEEQHPPPQVLLGLVDEGEQQRNRHQPHQEHVVLVEVVGCIRAQQTQSRVIHDTHLTQQIEVALGVVQVGTLTQIHDCRN